MSTQVAPDDAFDFPPDDGADFETEPAAELEPVPAWEQDSPVWEQDSPVWEQEPGGDLPFEMDQGMAGTSAMDRMAGTRCVGRMAGTTANTRMAGATTNARMAGSTTNTRMAGATANEKMARAIAMGQEGGFGRSTSRPRRLSPPAGLGPNLRLQAAEGYRAAVIELRPGLFLVAEVPDQMVQSEFGLASMLTPLLVKAATRALVQQFSEPQSPEQAELPADATLAPDSDTTTSLTQAIRQGIQRGFQALMDRPETSSQPGRRDFDSRVSTSRDLSRWADEDDLAGIAGYSPLQLPWRTS